MLVSKHTFSGPMIAKKDNYKYSNLIFDYRGSHFFENCRQNICVLLSQFLIDLEKRFWCLNIHFRDQGLHKMQFKIPKFIIFISMVVIFQNGRQNVHVLIAPLLINIEKRSLCLNIHFQVQDKRLGRIIWNTYLNDLINTYFIVPLIYLQIIATFIWMQIRYAWQCFFGWYRLWSVALKNDICHQILFPVYSYLTRRNV